MNRRAKRTNGSFDGITGLRSRQDGTTTVDEREFEREGGGRTRRRRRLRLLGGPEAAEEEVVLGESLIGAGGTAIW